MLSLYLVSAETNVVDPALQVASAGKVTGSATDQSNTTALIHVFKVDLAHVAVNERKNP